MKKTMLVLGVVMFFLTSACFGAKVDPAKITVPRDSGRVVETYVSPNADAPVIAYVQDIHVNYEAQKAEAAVMESLLRDYGFDLILLEGKGAGGSKDFKYLRANIAKDIRAQSADDLLKDGTISAVDYLDLATDYNFVVNGIEDMRLYKKETEDHIAIFGSKTDMEKLVTALRNITSNLKLHIYTKEHRDLDDKIAAYDKDEIGLVEYVKFLQGAAEANNIDVKALANVALFVESANLEGQIDFPAVETERTAAADAIEKALTEQAKKDEFLAKGLSFRTGDISHGAYYSYLKDAAVAAKVDISTSKNLGLYTSYITTFEKIDTTALFKELKTLEEKIQAALIKTPEQKKLAEISKGLEILSGFANTKLVPDEYNFYVQNKATFDLDGWLKFMKDNSAKFGLTTPVPDDISVLKASLPLLERFYAVSFDRDNAFIANIKASMAQLKKDRAILLAGGFHTPSMKKLLKENGFSYLIVAPRVDIIKNYEEVYKKISQIDLEALKKIVPAENVPAAKAAAGNRQRLSSPDNAMLAARVEQTLNTAQERAYLESLNIPNFAALETAFVNATAPEQRLAAAQSLRTAILNALPAEPGVQQIGNRITFDAQGPRVLANGNVLISGNVHAPGQPAVKVTAVTNFSIPGERVSVRVLLPRLVLAALRDGRGDLAREVEQTMADAEAANARVSLIEANPYSIGFYRPGDRTTPPSFGINRLLHDGNPVGALHELLEATLNRLAAEIRAANPSLTEAQARQQARERLINIAGIANATDVVVDETIDLATNTPRATTYGEYIQRDTIRNNQAALDHYTIRLVTRSLSDVRLVSPITGAQVSIADLDRELSVSLASAVTAQDGLAGIFAAGSGLNNLIKDQPINIAVARTARAGEAAERVRNSAFVQQAISAGAQVDIVELDTAAAAINWANGAAQGQPRAGQINLLISNSDWRTQLDTDEAANALRNVAALSVGDLNQTAQVDFRGATQPMSDTPVNGVLVSLMNIHVARTTQDAAQRERCIRALQVLLPQFINTLGPAVDAARIRELIVNNDVRGLIRLVVLPPAASIQSQRAQEIMLSVAFAVAA